MNESTLVQIARSLNQAKIGWCVGGSLMLYYTGIDIQAKDIDLFVLTEDFDAALTLLNQKGKLIEYGPSSIFGSDRFARGRWMGEEIDLIAGMKILGENGWVEYHMDPENALKCQIEGEEIPYGNIEDWIVLYGAMNRLDKVRLIESFMQRKGETG